MSMSNLKQASRKEANTSSSAADDRNEVADDVGMMHANHTHHHQQQDDEEPVVVPHTHEGEFYLRYYVGHKGRFGHEFMEFELSPSGKLRYANNSNYKTKHSRHQEGNSSSMIRREVYLSPAVVDEFQRIIRSSQIRNVDDKHWQEPSPDDDTGRQELEIKMGNEHIAFTCAEIGSLAQVQKSTDPEGLKILYFLTQDLKCLVMSLISIHFKVRPIPT